MLTVLQADDVSNMLPGKTWQAAPDSQRPDVTGGTPQATPTGLVPAVKRLYTTSSINAQ
jgi:hypothetical protein